MSNTAFCQIRNGVKIVFFLLFIPLIFQLSACKSEAKKVIKRFPDGVPSVVFEYADKSDTLNYVIKTYHHNGKVRQVATIKDGNFTGQGVTYYPDGKVSEIDSLSKARNMKWDDWDGVSTHFYENGKVSKRTVIMNGEANGLSQQYDSRGVLAKEYYLTHGLIKNGEYKEFYENGKVSVKETFKNDTIVGFAYFFKENGDSIKYYACYEGNPSLPIKKWLENGNVLEGKFLDNNEKAVIWKWYDKNGIEIKRKIVYPVNGAYVSPE
jgi:antitoxin component YwqK of YwqJK toxin-antitoxin module